jgi:hypothetical protein
LILRDKKEKAFESLKFLRSDKDDVSTEFREIEEFVEKNAKNSNKFSHVFRGSANRRGKKIIFIIICNTPENVS